MSEQFVGADGGALEAYIERFRRFGFGLHIHVSPGPSRPKNCSVIVTTNGMGADQRGEWSGFGDTLIEAFEGVITEMRKGSQI